MHEFSGYQKLISAATKVKDPDTLQDIEEAMRQEEGGVLDHLTKLSFDRLARACSTAAGHLDKARDEQSAREALPFKLFG